MSINDFFSALRAPDRADRPALRAPGETLTYPALVERVRERGELLSRSGARIVASLQDNGADWIVLDLACLASGAVHLPLPLFFSPEQIAATLRASGAQALACAAGDAERLAAFGFAPLAAAGNLALLRRAAQPAQLPTGTDKITFTSGSTGQPKGVCLGGAGMLAVAAGLARATSALGIARHLVALPLPVLLENIAGVYAPLLHGATVDVRPLAQVGLSGSSQFDPATLHAALIDARADSVIVLPQMLRAYAGWLHATRRPAPESLRLMAVGGAAVGAVLLGQARAVGLPAYEGYGLSEAASVQTLNLPGADLPGSAGRPLPHARVRIGADGQIEVAGSLALGYLGEPASRREWWPTGDLGRIDAAGFLHIQGRAKNVLITGFGRNVSPEWVEVALTSQPEIRHAVVLGDGQPALGAVVWPQGERDDAALARAIARANQQLPDYARIGPWLRGRDDFSAAAGLATANGRPRRDAILQRHADLFPSSLQPQLP
ncbi:MAG: AMP-binding protein [Achromobacter sp.]|uniref:AMP-binding protein n=1 Tax=Achromobacter sp. TaxID=134375 RepID=UPI003CFE5FD7